jgi:GNAT superfamily N-acetyltransferase
MLEKDIVPAMTAQYHAFRTSKGGKLLSPAPQPPSGYLSGSKESRLKAMKTNKNGRFMLVEDTDNNTVIACAHWDIYPDGLSAERLEELCSTPDPPPDANQAYWKDFFGHFADSRRALGTRPIAILFTIITAPEHQGRGAAKLLLKKFTEEVDEAAVEAYLEASQVARPLYAKFGFEPDFEKTFNLSEYSSEVDGVDVNTVMLRPAKTRKASA